MKNDKEKFKFEFRSRIYKWILNLVRILEKLPKDQVSNIVVGQVIRSGTSIGANYIEAQAASSKKDFINFLHHSLKSANESKFWLALLRDTGKMDKADSVILLRELLEIGNILASSLLTLKGRK